MTQFNLLLHPATIILTLITAITLLLVLKSKFHLHYHLNEKNRRRINTCTHIKKATFFPTPYLANGMLQAVFGKYSTYSDANIQFSKEVLVNPCGGKVGLHWATQIKETEKAKQNAKKAVIIMLPGLTASSQEPYIRNISSAALENGYKVAIYHGRGNRIEMIFPNEGHMDLVLDFKHSVDYVKKMLPDHMILAVGHSYGANILVSYLGRYKDEHPIKAAVSVANPYDFDKARQGVEGTMFDGFLVQVMKGWARRNEEELRKAPEHLELLYDEAMSCKSLTEFDEHITRKMLGFTSLLDYYEKFSCKRYIKDVNIPLFCLNSKDDPVLSNVSIPVEELKKNEHIILAITNNGGHVGWFEGLFKPKRWYPKPTMEFLNCCYDEITGKAKTD